MDLKIWVGVEEYLNCVSARERVMKADPPDHAGMRGNAPASGSAHHAGMRGNAPASGPCFAKMNPRLSAAINEKLMAPQPEKEESVYAVTLTYIKRLNDPRFMKKTKPDEINEAAFYRYAYIDKSTWSELKWEQITPSKKTLLKLVIALKLNEREAAGLMAAAHQSFDYRDPQELIILALIDLQVYDIDTVMEVLYEYGVHGARKFESIYDTPEMIAERRAAS